MQKYISQPSDALDGIYKVSRWNEVTQKYEEMATSYLCEEDSKDAARQFNKDYEDEFARQYEFEHQDDLIRKYHDYAISPEIQKRNSAREFFDRFPYQRDVCESIIKDLDKS